jgi:hypothetical protein
MRILVLSVLLFTYLFSGSEDNYYRDWGYEDKESPNTIFTSDYIFGYHIAYYNFYKDYNEFLMNSEAIELGANYIGVLNYAIFLEQNKRVLDTKYKDTKFESKGFSVYYNDEYRNLIHSAFGLRFGLNELSNNTETDSFISSSLLWILNAKIIDDLSLNTTFEIGYYSGLNFSPINNTNIDNWRLGFGVSYGAF